MFKPNAPDAAKAAATFVTRREALLSALKSAVTVVVAAPVVLHAAQETPAESEATFVPENDYPFFGYEP
jgi:hypothetical protein